MNVVSIHKKPEPNIDLVATLQVLLEQALEGVIQGGAIAVQYADGNAKHVYVGTNGTCDERMLLAELQICVVDATIGIAVGDPATFLSTVLTSDDE